jgi:ABC-2 type transport system permease protein
VSALVALVRTDLALFLQNRRAVIMSIAAPILIAAFFGYLFSDRSTGPTRIPVAVADRDQSALTHRIVAALAADKALEVSETSEDAGLTLVRTGKLRALITLPKGFGEEAAGALFGARKKPDVGLHYDPSQAIALQVIRGLLAQHVMESVAQSTFRADSDLLARTRASITSDADFPAALRADVLSIFDSVDRINQRTSAVGAGGSGPNFSVPYSLHEEQASARPQIRYNSFAHSFAGMSVQFIMLMGLDLGIGLLMMRRMGLWQRLRAAPLAKATLVGSRIASGTVIGILVLSIVYAAAIAAFGVRIEGNVIGFFGMIVALALLAATFGLLIAAIGRTPETTRGLAILVTLLLVMLSGAWVPSFLFPEWLQRISLFVPTRWAVDGLDAMTWRGLGIQAVLLPLGVTLGSAILFAAIAINRLSWEE